MKESSKNPRDRSHVGRSVTIAAGLLGATLLLAGCTAPAANVSAKGVISGPLSLWYTPATSGPAGQSAELFKKYQVDPFVKLHPKVTVTSTPVSVDNFDKKLPVALAAGAGPDLIPSGTAVATSYGAAGYLYDLSADAKTNGWQQKLLPWALQMSYVNGKLEAPPTQYETMVLYYNKTLFAKNGWKPPTDQASLETLAGEMQAKGIIPFAAGNASYQEGTEWLVTDFLNEVAGPAKIHDAIAGKIPWTDPSFVSSIQLLKTYFDKGYFGGGAKQYFSTQDPQKFAEFADGKAGMYLSGSWEMSTLPSYFGANGNKDDWAWAPLPPLAAGVPSNIYPLSVGGTMSVNAKSKNTAAGVAYMNWLFSDTKTMWASVKATGAEPLPITFSASDVPAGVDPRYVAQYTAINDASVKGNVGYTDWTSFGAGERNYIAQNIDKVLDHSLTVADFVKGMEAGYKADKAGKLIPPLFKTGS